MAASIGLLDLIKSQQTADQLGLETQFTIVTPTVAETLPGILAPLAEPVTQIFGETGTPLSSIEGAIAGEPSANLAPSLEADPPVGGVSRAIIGGIGLVVGGALLLSIF